MESIVIIFFLCIGVAYAVLLISFIIGNTSLHTDELSENIRPAIRFSVIIPFRNEEANLEPLLASLVNIDYVKDFCEVIFVDDASEDASVETIEAFLARYPNINYQILKNQRVSKSPKKDAISLAVSVARFEWILTTDADCMLPVNWLNSFNQFILAKDPVFIAGPVMYQPKNGFLNAFETLDFLSLMGSAMGGFGLHKPFLCNGANMAYLKEVFLRVNGFSNNTQIASGDDIFLLEKINRAYPKKLHFLKQPGAIVTTFAQGNLKKLVKQRLRWAAKAPAYKNQFTITTGIIVFAMNLALMLVALLVLIDALPTLLLVILFLIKFNLDFMLLYPTAKFFNQENLLRFYFLSSLLYPFFNVFIALRSFFGGYEWKGRYFDK